MITLEIEDRDRPAVIDALETKAANLRKAARMQKRATADMYYRATRLKDLSDRLRCAT